jgi:4-aminobutyrate aminotransferase-like enzyme
MSASSEILAKHRRHLWPCITTYYEEPVVVDRAKGHEVWDADGKKYLDFFGGILTVSVGHSHPHVTQAVQKQAEKLVHVSTLYPMKPQADLAEKIAGITPKGGDLTTLFFTNSGSEADETAVQLAKSATGSNTVIGLRHGYSGRTVLARQLTAHSSYRGLDDEMTGVKQAHSPYCYRCPWKASPETCGMECAQDIEELIQTTTPGRVAAFLAETIQGVGGFITPPKDYFKVAVPIVKKYGGLFICDEVQAGFGRTGERWFGIEHYDVMPDIITMAKGIANGYAMGATATRPDLAAKWKGSTVSTFGGNPVSCAAAQATIEVMEREDLPANAAKQGARLRERLLQMQEKHAAIGEVRGKGLMQAAELVVDRKTKEPAKKHVLKIFEETKKRGLLIGRGGLYANVLRITPSLDITAREVDDACDILDQAFTAAGAPTA